jgi:hypothetical protein
MGVDDQIPCHREQPGPYRATLQRVRMTPRTQQRLLDHILRLMPITLGQAQDVPQERSPVFGVQSAQKALVRSRSHTSDTYQIGCRFTVKRMIRERSTRQRKNLSAR